MPEPAPSEELEKKERNWVTRETRTGLRFRGQPTRREYKVQIGKLKAQKEVLKQESQTDFLTGLLNRRGLVNEAERIKGILDREKANRGFTVIVADMIGLKRLNDELGAEGADEILKNSAQSFQIAASRGTDLVSRWGGDEFVLVLFNEDPSKVEKFVETILKFQPKLARFNIGYRNYDAFKRVDEAVIECVDKIDAVKKIGPTDETGRATGNGTVIDLTTINV